MINKVEISHRTILFTLCLLLGLWVLVQIRDILFLIFISFILMSALRPLVEGLSRFRIPRVVSILLIYTLVFGIFGVSIARTIPSLVVQYNRLIQALPSFLTKLVPYWKIDPSAFTQQIAPISENILRVTVGIFSNIVTTLTVLVFTFYFLLERRNTQAFLTSMMGEPAAFRVIEIVRIIEKRLGSWLHGQLFLMVLIGILVYVGLTLLHMEFALPLAIIAGVLEIVPLIGPIISGIPAVLIALATSPLLALSVGALYFIIQQLENQIVVPVVIRRSVGLSPIITIFALMVGGRLAGIVGAVLAVPIVIVLQEAISAYLGGSIKGKGK